MQPLKMKLMHLAKAGMFDNLSPSDPEFDTKLQEIAEKIKHLESNIGELVMLSGNADIIKNFSEIYISRMSLIQLVLYHIQKHKKMYKLAESGEVIKVDEKFLCSILENLDTSVPDAEKAKLLTIKMEQIVASGKCPILPGQSINDLCQKLDGTLFILLIMLETLVYGTWNRELSEYRGGEMLNELMKQETESRENGKE